MSKINILIVDDDPVVRESYAYFLEDEGYGTQQAGSVDEAILVLDQSPCEIALLDMKMAGESDGLLLNQRIHQRFPLVQTIIVTAHTNYSSAVQALKDGAVDYISKAASNGDILSAIDAALNKRKEMEKEFDAAPMEPLASLSLVCDHSLIREGLLHFTNEHTDFVLVSHYRNLSEVFLDRDAEFGDICLVCAACNCSDIEAVHATLQKLHLSHPEMAIVFLNHAFSTQEKAELLIKGVRGFLPEKIDADLLSNALSKLASGEIWAGRLEVSKALRTHSIAARTSSAGDISHSMTLTPRERDVLRHAAMECTNKEIAIKMGVSERTIKTHLYNIYQKLDVHSRSKAVAAAYKHHLLP